MVPYEQIDVAGGSREIRAFIFKRNNAHYVVYTHISDNKKLELSLKPSDITLYKKMGQDERFSSGANNTIVVPAGDRNYIKANRLTKEQLIEAFKNARIIE